jgi:hypothetical protein
LDVLGGRPDQPRNARARDVAAGRVDSYRLRYLIDDRRGLGEPSRDRRRSIDGSTARVSSARSGAPDGYQGAVAGP